MKFPYCPIQLSFSSMYCEELILQNVESNLLTETSEEPFFYVSLSFLNSCYVQSLRNATLLPISLAHVMEILENKI